MNRGPTKRGRTLSVTVLRNGSNNVSMFLFYSRAMPRHLTRTDKCRHVIDGATRRVGTNYVGRFLDSQDRWVRPPGGSSAPCGRARGARLFTHAGIMHELPLIVFQIDYSKCPIQLPAVPPAHHLPMRVLAQMRHRKLGETGGHGHSNLHLEPTLASWHPRMARPRALAQASVERPRDEAPPATSWRPAGASQLLPPATLLHSIGLLRQA